MQENKYRNFLIGRLSTPSVNSYIAYCSQIERELAIDLGNIDLGEAALPNWKMRLEQRGIAPNSVANCMTAMRAYAAMQLNGSNESILHLDLPPLPEVRKEIARTECVRESSTSRLLGLYGEILGELAERKIIRTGNSPVGDYGELLFAQAFGWSLADNSVAGYDATDTAGVRYQIKTRRLSGPKASRQLSAIRNLDKLAFDFLAAVLLDGSFQVIRAALIPHRVVS